MTSLISTALVLGAMGSTHCLGMCGPIALSLPPIKDTAFSRFFGTLLYNFGRVLTYSLIGIMVGSIGETFVMAGWQQGLSIVLGTILLLFILVPHAANFFHTEHFSLRWLKWIRNSIGKLFQQRTYASVFFIGLLNGLLPCGLVYIAVAGAIASGSTLNGAVFMAFFGLGTLPMMWAIGFMGGMVSISLRKTLRKAYPFIVVLMGCLLILRGLELNIPFISPGKTVSSSALIMCH
jgi:sulfite exporter TauE/SafE